ncbi:MAG: hypothetical protein U0U67_06605 [Chitinophagales bacterium]
MSAIVGILNKQGIAIAADSAVTIDTLNGHKIFNGANKVFSLSKHHPVGIMIYNSASFLSTPWEIIIKVYRKNIGSKSFNSLEEYKNDFIDFIKAKGFYTDHNTKVSFLTSFFIYLFDDLNKTVFKENNLSVKTDFIFTDDEKAIISEGIKKYVNIYLNQLADFDICEDFMNYTIEEFKTDCNESIDQLMNLYTTNGFNFDESLKNEIISLLYKFTITKHDFCSYSGIVFVGYGELEIYPSLIPVNISIVCNNKLRFFTIQNDVAKISNDLESAIRPFAQTDVINTILSGSDPDLDDVYLENFNFFFQKYNNLIIETLKDVDPKLIEKIKAIDIQPTIKEYADLMMQTRKVKYIEPLMDAVSTLSKEDLAEMAESLIYLTYLKRRITFAEESVGGPVDVAVLTKGDGFIWLKRKHYFKPELNRQFFDNYFN